jgi:hypothetical protein
MSRTGSADSKPRGSISTIQQRSLTVWSPWCVATAGPGKRLELETRFCQLWTVRPGTAVAMEEYPTREEALASVAEQAS